jgi:hypothetical protein
MIRQSVSGLATRSCAPLKKEERDQAQNRCPLLLIAREALESSAKTVDGSLQADAPWRLSRRESRGPAMPKDSQPD